MDAEFWHERWAQNRIGFHKAEVNPLLTEHLGALDLPPGGRIFVPMCGKTRDIGWLLAQGFHVVGVELSRLAVEQLFADLGVVPEVVQRGALTKFSADGLEVFAGDVFDLTAEVLGAVDGVYDRAALVALPFDMRADYGAHVARITGSAPQLVVCFQYDQNAMTGPPFSVDAGEMSRVYAPFYDSQIVSEQAVEGGMGGKIPAQELVWILR